MAGNLSDTSLRDSAAELASLRSAVQTGESGSSLAATALSSLLALARASPATVPAGLLQLGAALPLVESLRVHAPLSVECAQAGCSLGVTLCASVPTAARCAEWRRSPASPP